MSVRNRSGSSGSTSVIPMIGRTWWPRTAAAATASRPASSISARIRGMLAASTMDVPMTDDGTSSAALRISFIHLSARMSSDTCTVPAGTEDLRDLGCA